MAVTRWWASCVECRRPVVVRADGKVYAHVKLLPNGTASANWCDSADLEPSEGFAH